MRILALETSTGCGSVAVLDGDQVVGQTELPSGQRTTQTLAPTIVEQLQRAGWRPADLQLIAVTQGPGSFTGLRIAVTTAKTLAYAVGAEVIGLNTLTAIAAQTPESAREVRPVLDAGRGQLYAARLCRLEDNEVQTIEPTRIIDIAAWLKHLAPPVAVSGPGLRRLLDRLPSGVTMIDQQHWTPRAATVGQLAYQDYQQGRRDDLWKLSPLYYRQSAAEEKLALKNSAP